MKSTNLLAGMLSLTVLFTAGSVCSEDKKVPNITINRDVSVKTAPKESSTVSGKVIETFNSGGYTYALLESKGSKIWIAAPEMQLKAGQVAEFQKGAIMPSFMSKTLNRKFENIMFSPGPAVMGATAGAHTTTAATTNAKQIPIAPSAEKIKVAKASGVNAYTVSELYEKKGQLDKKNITVRGKVVKVSPAIMKKNWIHIQDGTGSAEKSNNDLVVTSLDIPSVGDVVIVNGVLSKDKDFGAGYKYTVVVENAKITR